MKKIALVSLLILGIAAIFIIRTVADHSHPAISPTPTEPQVTAVTTATATPGPSPAATQTSTPGSVYFQKGNIPNFDHIVMIVLENEYMQSVLGSPRMPNFNALAKSNVLLSNYSAVAHPSLPNYLVLISGSVQNISTDCTDCSVNAPNLADEIEVSGRTWKAYFQDMPSPCFTASHKPYEKIFNPFIYFDSIQKDPKRCDASIVPLTQLDADLKADQLPNFMYIAPNVCNSGHDCKPEVADAWLGQMVAKLQKSTALGSNSLIVITFDEGVQQTQAVQTHGEVATVLISPLATHGYVDSTAYSHYSLLKTILAAWQLPALGDTYYPVVNTISNPWVDQVGLIYPHELTPVP